MRRQSAAHAPHECRPPQRAEHRFALERTLERNELVSNWIDEARRIPKRGLRRIASHAGSVGHDEPVRFEFVEHPTKQHIIEPTDATRTLAFLGPIAAEEEDRDAFDVVERLDGVVLMPGEGDRCSVGSDARREVLVSRAAVGDGGVERAASNADGTAWREFGDEAMRCLALWFEMPAAAEPSVDAGIRICAVQGVDEVCEAIHCSREVGGAAAGVEEGAGHAAARRSEASVAGIP